MATYLPEEVVVLIFSWLPPKSLIRFKCVSKRWHALIGNPDFLSKNLLNHSIVTENPSDPRRLTLFLARDKSDSGKKIHSFRSYDSLRCASQTPLNLPPPASNLNIVASCNGLLCLWDKMRSDIYLWDPATSSDLKALPAAPSRRQTRTGPNDCFGFHSVGFGFDPVSNDFKVVTLVDEDGDGLFDLKAELYSQRSGSWRVIDMTFNFEFHLLSQSAALDRFFLWYDDEVYEEYVDDRLAAFDFSDEEFFTMTFPDARFFCDYAEYTRTVTELKGRVAMMFFPFDDEMEKMYLDLWVMLEFGVTESWTRLLSIELPLHLERPLRFWKNGELFMVNSEEQLVLYDFFTQTETNLQFEGSPGTLKVVDCNFVQFEGMGSASCSCDSCQLHYATQFDGHEDCRRKQQELQQKLEEAQILLRDMQEGMAKMLKMREEVDMLMALFRRSGGSFGGDSSQSNL